MTSVPISIHSPSVLRERAQALLQAKGASLTAAKDPSTALRVLFDLASSPDTAHDALALLHELQVHQVELDLQNEELQRSRAELESAWAYQLQWHDASPSAQLVLDEAGCLLECNAGALKSLNQDIQHVLGKRLETWLAAGDVPGVQAWLAVAQKSDQPVSLCLQLHAADQTMRSVCAAAQANPMAPGVLVAWVDLPSIS
ncbi:hypothetical protein [Limnohabitans sp. Jir72]|uniref:hypothetical protein n=1 Tax=Limnohabitans sp. Jir72 TaxID=1977909 RepID=UPI0018EE9AF0|nr:hypothetical protein [Limnohabitans sp. Jir72]